MWHQLRARRLAGFKFKRQWTIGAYIVDFCCWDRKLIVEIDGGQHGPERDAGRTRWLEGQGYTVRRFWNNDVLTNMEGVLTLLLQDLGVGNVALSDPLPSPLPQAGEGV